MNTIDLSPQGRAGPPATPGITAADPPAASDVTTVRLSGEIDVATGPALRERLLRVLHENPPRTLVLDLSDVSFCDAFGLGVLVGVRNHALSREVTVALAAPRPFLSRLLHITGLDRAFTLLAEPPGEPETPSR